MSYIPIYQNGKFLGDLTLNDDESVSFEPNPLEPVPPFEDMVNFLENLLPEGARDKWYKAMRRLPSNTTVGYLQKYGEDLAGNITCIKFRPGKPVDRTKEILELIAEGAPLDATVKGQKSLLSGVDPKIAVIYDDGKFLMPNANNPSTHILKYNNQLCLNEHFCMRLMKSCGIPVANTELLCLEGKEVLLVERFDRKDGEKLLAADFCQVLSKSANEKYKVTWKEIGEYLNKENVSRAEREALLDATFFNIIIGCSDDHAKNISFVGETRESFKLAPFYDIASLLVAKNCSRAYKELETGMPRAIGSQKTQHKLKKVHLKMLAETLGLDPDMACERFGHILTAIRKNSPTLLEEMKRKTSNFPFSETTKTLHNRFFKEMEKTIQKETNFFSQIADFSDNQKIEMKM